MRGLPREVQSSLAKAREFALLAVGTYNRPGTIFRSGGYIVLMAIAWTSLFHAIFLRKKIKPFYVKVRRGRYIRYEKVDGDHKAWELAECLKQFYKDQNPPVRKNLEFFIGLRNKIEHRNMPGLDDRIFGECQSLLFNFETLLAKEFGDRYSLNESLAVSLQFSTVTPKAKSRALRRMQSKYYKSVTAYVDQFRSSLSSDIEQSMEYSFRVFLLPKTGNHAKSSDLAVEFINLNALDDDSRQEFERAVTLLKTRESAVANPGQMKPSHVARNVQMRLGLKFGPNDHTRCWKYFKVRPPTAAPDPTKCDTRFCQYDVPHRDYIYTNEWEDLLVSKLSDTKVFEEVLGKVPESLSGGDMLHASSMETAV